ncbi:MAG: ABC transporter permease [Gemmatimonadota bacterium]|jgi:putative ABC transport system permease protein
MARARTDQAGRNGGRQPGVSPGGVRPTGPLVDLVQDIRFAFRSLARQPGFVLAAVLTLGVGIGANVAMFSVANLALFRALPYPHSDRLVLGRTSWPGGGVGWTVSAPDYYDVRDQAKSFSAIGAMTPFTYDVTVTGGGEAERVPLDWVSPGFFRTLGAPPLMGREFTPREGEPGAAPTVMVSYGFWQRRLGGRPDVVGSTVTVNGMPQTVVGVMPKGFAFQADAQIWAPMVRGESFASERRYHNWLVVGRLAPGVTLSAARSEVDVIMGQLADAYPASNKGLGMVITPVQSAMVESFRASLLMLMGAIGLVLLIACGNVASLLLARGSARSTEMALRTALGAGRSRIVRQLLTEAAVLGIAAGLLGTGIALALQRTLVAATPLTRLGLQSIGIQPAVLVFALLLSLATVLVSGLAPALAAARVDLSNDLKAGARSVAGGRSRFRSGLVVAQVALSVVLLVGAGLLIRSFQQLRDVDPGFDTQNLLTADISLPRTYEDAALRSQFFDALLTRVRAMPGVQAAGLTSALPIRNGGNNVGAWDPSHPPADASQVRLAFQRIVKPGYFAAMGIPIREGRDVQTTDAATAPPVMVINETMARTLFPGEDPLGRQVAIDAGDDPGGTRFEVVGVVGDAYVSGLSYGAQMVMYFSYEQRPQYTMRLAVRTAGPPSARVRSLRSTLTEMDPDVPLADPRTMDDVLAGSVSSPRTVAAALTGFAGVALFLAALGLYGVLAYYVSRRGHEIGVRMALGARARNVFGLILGQGFALVGMGLLLGIAVAVVGSRFLQQFLFEVNPRDPVTFVGVPLFFAAVALAACLIPAWRAWRVDPVEAFRAE